MKAVDLTGQKFGELTALERIPCEKNGRRFSKWLCRCSCGNHTTVKLENLKNGHTKTCGRCRKFEEENDYMRCTLRNGRSFIFDAEDLPFVSSCAWSVDEKGYVLGYKGKLHRLLMGSPANRVVDHINGDPSDCRKANLRCITQHQNTQNSSLPKHSTTGYKGVCFDKRRKRYMAHIHPNGRMKHLGYYDTPEEAAVAYDRAASLYFGEFAKLNFAEVTP